MSPSVHSLLWLEAEEVGPETVVFAGGRVVAFAARGPGKAVNEDGLALFPCDASTGVLAVADGLGGQPSGAKACRIALESLAESVGRARSERSHLREAILDGFEQANDRIQQLGVGAGTTLAVLEIRGEHVRTFHVGDSEIMIVGQRGKQRLRTVPHSPVGYAVEAGWIDRREAMHHDQRHLITNVVGSPQMRVEMGPVLRLRSRDRVVVASDGLYDNLHPEEIVELVRCGDPLQRSRRMIALCRQRMSAVESEHPSKPDDLVFALFGR